MIPRPLTVHVRVDETGDIPIQETAADNWFGMKQTDSGHKMGCRWEGRWEVLTRKCNSQPHVSSYETLSISMNF